MRRLKIKPAQAYYVEAQNVIALPQLARSAKKAVGIGEFLADIVLHNDERRRRAGEQIHGGRIFTLKTVGRIEENRVRANRPEHPDGAAPRLRASMPTAPVPAYTSAKTLPEILGANTLKSASRRRSGVGRTVRPGRLLSARLRNSPPITLTSAHLDQPVAALPVIANELNRPA